MTCLHSTCSKQLQVQNRYPLLKHMCPPPPDRIKYVQGRARPPPSSSFSYSDCLATPSFNMPYAGSCYPAAAGCLPSSQTPVRHHVIRLPQPRRVNVLRVLLAYIQGLRGTSSFPQKKLHPWVTRRLRQPRRAAAPNRLEVEGAAANLALLSLLPSIRHPP